MTRDKDNLKLHNILSPVWMFGPPRGAKGSFPYPHPTIAQVDARIEQLRKAKERREKSLKGGKA